MDESETVDPGLSDQYRKASPWPLFVALGFAISEAGVLFGVVPVAVGGLLLFGGSIAGIVREAGYAERPWPLLAALGVVFSVAGALVVGTQVGFAPTIDALVDALLAPTGVTLRGLSILGAGGIMVAVGVVATVLEPPSN